MSSPWPSWPLPVSRTTVETLVKPLEVSRAKGSSWHWSIRSGRSATRAYVAAVPVAGAGPSPGGTAISEPRDTEPQVVFGVTPIPRTARISLLGRTSRRGRLLSVTVSGASSALLAWPCGDQAGPAPDRRHRRLHGVHAVPPQPPRSRGSGHDAHAREGCRCGPRLRPRRDRGRRRVPVA